MFSCCRSNPKNVKPLKKDKKEKSNTNINDKECDDSEKTNEKCDKKLIIPTITIDSNGKDIEADIIDDIDGNNASEDKQIAEHLNGIDVDDDDDDDDHVDVVVDGDGDECAIINNVAQQNDIVAVEYFMEKTTNVEIDQNNSDEQSKSSAVNSYTDDSVNTVINQYATIASTETPISMPAQATITTTAIINTATATTTTASIHYTNDDDTDAGTMDEEQQYNGINHVGITDNEHDTQGNGNANANVDDDDGDNEVDEDVDVDGNQKESNTARVHDVPQKSCLSRHNSTHTSIKKKVNISTFAEIIEPDPLPPPPPYDHLSMGDDDDVFSDSLPPPKRDSMCAPYIERDELPEVAFVHGLPEWFNDERIHDIGCIEPPVTPVGRDELELKRQRLYTDLLRAAHAAVEHNVRFTPLCVDPDTIPLFNNNYDMKIPQQQQQQGVGVAVGDGGGDCDPDLKPSVAENFEQLLNRLERLVERLERSVSARELEIANRTFDSVLEKKRESFDLEQTALPLLPSLSAVECEINQQTKDLNERILRIESSLNRINDSQSNSASLSLQQQQQQAQQKDVGSLENIPTTVLEDYPSPPSQSPPLPPPPLTPPPTSIEATIKSPITNMSVYGYQDIITGPLSKYLELSSKIGGDVATHAALVKSAFDAQLRYITLATEISKPSSDKQMELLKPTSTQISAIQDLREKHRASPYFNHLSAISESIPALGWVCVEKTPGPHVKEMNDAGQFYTNRVLKEWKEKDAKHVEWARAWIQTLTELQAFIKQFHTTGLVWSGKGSAPVGGAAPPPPPIGGCPPPPPPPAFDLNAMSLDGGSDDRSALFAEINQGENITRNLKKVTADMQTHKNPTLRTGPAPFKPTQFGSVNPTAHAPVAKQPVFTRDGKKWLIEYQKNNTGLIVDNAEMNNVVYMFKCEGSTLTVKGKVNNVVLDSCKKCSLLFDSVVASIEFVNCQSVQMQVLGSVPTISIDKTDGCQMYLSKDSMAVEIISSKSSEMNVMLPQGNNGDYNELPLPEQFKTTISGKTLKTVCVDSLG